MSELPPEYITVCDKCLKATCWQGMFLCHEARIRGYIGPLAPRYLEIHLSEREATGQMQERHPGLQEAVNAWRNEFPPDHSIVHTSLAVSRPASNSEAK